MKLAIIIGTRPEIIRLAVIINKCRKLFETFVIHTGQNYDYNLNEIFFKELGIDSPDFFLNCSKNNLGEAVGDVISKSYTLFTEIKPDAILVLGDTNSSLCCYPAKRLKIPIFHMEAGNRCFDVNVPEEINRKIVDHLADVNLCYSEHARRNLMKETFRTEYTFVTGSPMNEVINYYKDKIDSSNVLHRLNLTKNDYILFSSHREENIDNKDNFSHIIDTINALVIKFNMKIIFSVHPRTQKKITNEKVIFPDKVILSEPFGYFDYCSLQKNAFCVISDSGTLTEESYILDFPAVLLRNSTERPEGVDSGKIILGCVDKETILQSINILMSSKISLKDPITQYDCMNVSDKVIKIISGYIPIVNKFIWMK